MTGEAYSVVIDGGFCAAYGPSLGPRRPVGVSGQWHRCDTNELAQSSAEKPDDVQLQTPIAEAMHTSPLTANSLIVVHVNRAK